ncbi:MAG: ABC transporter permease [Flexilinea sp.]
METKKISAAQIYRKYGILLIFIMLFVASALINKNFLKPQNLMNILKQISVITIIACGETLLIVSGLIDLSAGLTCTLASCFSAGVLVSTGSVPLAFLTAIGTGVIVGWANGFLITRFNLQAFIATLAMTNIAKGITQVYTHGSAINGVDKIKWLGQKSIGIIPVPVILMLFCVLLVFVLMRFTKLGLYIYAIGGNEKATLASGINIHRTKRLIFCISGALIGISGILLTSRMMSGQPSVGDGYEFDAITAVIVGGTSFTGGIGSVIGTLIGSIIVGMINNVLNLLNVSTQYQLIVKGVLIAGAVILDMKTKSGVISKNITNKAGKNKQQLSRAE